MDIVRRFMVYVFMTTLVVVLIAAGTSTLAIPILLSEHFNNPLWLLLLIPSGIFDISLFTFWMSTEVSITDILERICKKINFDVDYWIDTGYPNSEYKETRVKK